MKIWCIFKSDTAIKWRELLVVEQPSPLACVAYNISGETAAKLSLDFVFCAEVISHVTFFPGFPRQNLILDA